MSSLVKNNAQVLKLLTRIRPEARKKVIHALDKETICSICECAHNTLKGNVRLSSAQKQKLSRHRKVLRRLSQQGESWRIKKKVIKQSGGFLAPLLIPVLTSILQSILTK